MSIDNILEGAAKPEHSRKGADLQEIIDGVRIPKLFDFFSKGLDQEAKNRFNSLNHEEKIAELQKNNYKIKDEYVDQMADELVLYVIKEHNKTAYEHMKEALATKNNSDASLEDKQEAAEVILQYSHLALKFGLDVDKIRSVGKTQGLSSGVWNELTKNIGAAYQKAKEDSYLHLASDDDFKKYIKEKIHPDTGIKADEVIAKGREVMERVARDYHTLKKNDDVESFKKAYHHHH